MVGGRSFSRGHLYRILSNPLYVAKVGHKRQVYHGLHEAIIEPQPDSALIRALAQAHRWRSDLIEGRFATLREIAAAYDTDERYAAWVIRLAFLSPELTRSILDGTQPWEFTLHRMLKAEVPLRWEQQDVRSR